MQYYSIPPQGNVPGSFPHPYAAIRQQEFMDRFIQPKFPEVKTSGDRSDGGPTPWPNENPDGVK